MRLSARSSDARRVLETLEQRRLLSAATHGVNCGHDHSADQSDHGVGCSCGSCGSVDLTQLTLAANIEAQIAQKFEDRYVTTDGGVIYHDPLVGELAGDNAFVPAGPYNDAGGTSANVTRATQPAFSSRPGASKTIFLDFDGHIVTDGSWTRFNNNNDIHAAPYDTDGDIFTFSQAELTEIQQTFERMAEDFSAWDVNVTTVDPGDAVFSAGGQALRVMFSTDVDSAAYGGTGNRWYSGAGGVAYLNSWYSTTDRPVWAFTNNLGSDKGYAEAGSHEVGHAFGLRHDGGGGDGSYYRGHGSGDTSWGPLMGVGYYTNLTQWSKGEYNQANNTEDDLAIIADGVDYRSDDHPDSTTGGTPISLSVNGNDASFSVTGNIERSTDLDSFTLTLDRGGDATINLNNSAYTNLDAAFTVFNASGSEIAFSDNPNNSETSLSLRLEAGTYTFRVDGVGKGDPLATGYTDYGSLGEYNLNASLTLDPPSDDEPLVITSLGFEYETRQAITVGFDRAIDTSSFTRSDFFVTNYTINQTIVASRFDIVATDATNQNFALVYNVATYGFMPDGDYRVTIPANSINAADGGALETGETQTFFVLAGDANRDRVVDLADFTIMRNNFGSGSIFSQADFNYDGTVDLDDFAILRNNFGKTV